MKICDITILSKGVDWEDRKNLKGEVNMDTNTFTLNYSIDGDNCFLSFNGSKVVQQRKGAQFIYIEFIKGKFTECVIGNGGLCGSYKIFTENLDYKVGSKGFRLMLEYVSGEDKEKIYLVLTAYVKEKR